jgi:O-antigen ligase
VYKLKIKFKYLFSAAIVVGVFLAINWSTILMKLEKNRQDSSAELASHVESISNVSTDASNLERLNRWHSAWRMFKERPVFGWGPGTYAFVYAPFQLSYEKTIISTNAGDMGNAHSEYLGPLSEQGVLGMLGMILLVAMVYYYGSYLYHRLPEKELKGLALTIVLSLTTYFVHGVLNNYLDTDKASVPFWGFIAALVAIDVYSKNKTTKEIEASIR